MNTSQCTSYSVLLSWRHLLFCCGGTSCIRVSVCVFAGGTRGGFTRRRCLARREPLQRHRYSVRITEQLISHQSRFLLAIPEFLHFSYISCRRIF